MTSALDWIEGEYHRRDDSPTCAPLLQLRRCNKEAVTAVTLLKQGNRVEIRGPSGRYPLAVGLSLLAAASGRPWTFTARPTVWRNEDWQAIAEAFAMLVSASIEYREGFRSVSVGIQPIA